MEEIVLYEGGDAIEGEGITLEDLRDVAGIAFGDDIADEIGARRGWKRFARGLGVALGGPAALAMVLRRRRQRRQHEAARSMQRVVTAATPTLISPYRSAAVSRDRSIVPADQVQQPMGLGKAINVEPGASATFHGEPLKPIQPTRLMLSSLELDGWSIESFRIGAENQNIGKGPIPAALFGPRVEGVALTFSPCRAGVPIELVLKNNGSTKSSISGSLVGTTSAH